MCFLCSTDVWIETTFLCYKNFFSLFFLFEFKNALACCSIYSLLAHISWCFHSAAYSTSVQVVNTTVKTNHTPEKALIGVNPAPGICLPVIVSFCQYHKVPYNYTVFPNYMGHFGQRDAQQELEVYDALVDVRCYELAALFLCSVFVPKCGPGGVVVRPCLSLCMGKFKLKIFRFARWCNRHAY